MSKEKQIEELSEFFYRVDGTTYRGGPIRVANYDALARALYDEGYRKQSGWISVDERLPEESGEYITYHEHGSYWVIYYNAAIHLWNVYYCEDKKNAIRSITHWMPLPEPPDMKGGE